MQDKKILQNSIYYCLVAVSNALHSLKHKQLIWYDDIDKKIYLEDFHSVPVYVDIEIKEVSYISHEAPVSLVREDASETFNKFPSLMSVQTQWFED